LNFPEQERYSFEDAAVRLGKSVSYVKDMTRRGILPAKQGQAILETIPTSSGVKRKRKLTLTYYITRYDLEQFEHTYGGPKGEWKHKKEAADFFDFSVKTLERRVEEEDKKVKKGLLKEQDRQCKTKPDGKRILVFVPAEFLSN